MKLIDYSKIDYPKFEPKNPIVFQNSKTKYYEIEYDAVYEDGHIEKKTGFSSYNYDFIEEYLRDYFEIDDRGKGITGCRGMSMKCEKLHNLLQNYYDGEIFLCIDFPNGRAIYTRGNTDKKSIISSKIFESYPLELIFTVIVVKGWLL